MNLSRKALSNSNLIFLHIPKNGGTTLHRVIERKYAAEAIYTIRELEKKRSNIPEFISLSEEERSKIKVIKGHLQFGIHEHLVGPSNYITFLRKPKDRVLSYYNYVRKRPDHRMYEAVKDLSLYDFVREYDANDIHNTQVQWISGMSSNDTEAMVQQALRNIENHFSFVGFLEHYNTSLILLSQLYGWGVPWYTYRNKGSYKKTEQLDAKTLRLIAEKNAADQQLYDILETQFLRSLRKSPLVSLKVQQLELVNRLRSSDKLKRLLKLRLG